MKGRFSFIVRDEALDFDDISRKLKIRPTSITKKGEFIRKKMGIQAPYDIWLFEVIITEELEPEEALDELLNKLTPNFKEINELIWIYTEVNINCYLRSDYGQMGLELSIELIKKLAYLGVGLNIHILSFGGVKS
ncbi:DUF4279 domain-containing protein [Paenibacillus sp. NPDC058177]|uniref:DUF4279 domain-containing protein n=1 Tax=Paenibacillus sp. NPDC058177 TaxID=3346369 RepID=UPI0036DCF7ED